MAKLSLVHCRICGRDIDRNIEKENIDWIMPSRNWYYHTKCYNDWKVNSTHSDEEWVELIYDFISRDMKVKYDYHMCETQRKKFLTQNYTNKGIYFSLKYFYEIKNGDWSKGSGGIGIIPFIYKEATEYWTSQELKRAGTIAAIEQQIYERTHRQKKVINVREDTNKKKRWELDEL